MEVVYLFYESDNIRIPFFDYDQPLFRRLCALGGGRWDNIRHEFIFRRNENDSNHKQFSPIFTYIPCVQVDNNTPSPLGFWERPWDNTVSAGHIDLPEKQTVFSAAPLPEKFPPHWQDKLEAELRSRKYSPNTRCSYVYYNRLFCRTLQKCPEDIQSGDITQFLAIMEKNKDSSASAVNLAISAIKFFYKNVLKNNNISEQHRPRHDKRLPIVFSKTEISKIIGMEKNPKHRLLLMLAYSSGLRVSEVVALKKEHIDLSRKVIHVRSGKGRKDRCTILSENAIRFITEYYDLFDIKNWLFPGQPPTQALTIRSAQHIFDKAVQHAEIPKKTSIHSLRHTFATHLLESGTDIRYIQSLLGHANLRTTERYAHVAQRNVLRIQSPLDTITISP